MITDTNAGMPNSQTTDRSIIAYFNDGHSTSYGSGETVIHDFDEPKGVFLIKEGFIKAYSVSRQGQNNLFFIHQAGEIIPLPWALDGAHITGLSYETISDDTCTQHSKRKFTPSYGA